MVWLTFFFFFLLIQDDQAALSNGECTNYEDPSINVGNRPTTDDKEDCNLTDSRRTRDLQMALLNACALPILHERIIESEKISIRVTIHLFSFDFLSSVRQEYRQTKRK